MGSTKACCHHTGVRLQGPLISYPRLLSRQTHSPSFYANNLSSSLGPLAPPPTSSQGPPSPLGSPTLLLSTPWDMFPSSSNIRQPPSPLSQPHLPLQPPTCPSRQTVESSAYSQFSMYSPSQALCLLQPAFHSCHMRPQNSSKSPMTSVSLVPLWATLRSRQRSACLESLCSGCLSPPLAPPGHPSCLSFLILSSPRQPRPQSGRSFSTSF